MTMAMTNKPLVLLIAGTIHRPSQTRALLAVIADCLQARGAETVEWDLVKNPLPIADPEFDGIPLRHPDANVREFARVEQLLVLANLESMNAEFIRIGLTQADRFCRSTWRIKQLNLSIPIGYRCQTL